MQDQEKKFDNDQHPDSSELNDQENNEQKSPFTGFSGLPGKPKFFVLAFTGVTVIDINGTTINSRLNIPPYGNGYALPRLSDSEKARLRRLYSQAAVVLIDEISMVSNIHLLHIYKKLYKTVDCLETQ